MQFSIKKRIVSFDLVVTLRFTVYRCLANIRRQNPGIWNDVEIFPHADSAMCSSWSRD